MLPNNEEQTTKADMHDLLLGETNEPASKGKKFFLIAAGVLLIFFVALGAMKILGSKDDEKQSVAISQTPASAQAPAPVADTNMSVDANATTDEKLNEIVQKLQQEAAAQSQATQSTAPTEVAPIKTPALAEHKAEAQHKVTPAPKVQEAPAVVQAPAPSPVKAQAVPIAQAKPKPAPVLKEEQTAPQSNTKALMAEATKKQPQPAAKPATQAAAKPTPKPAAAQPAPASGEQAQSGGYYIQVGAFAVGADSSATQSKATSLGFKSVVKQVQSGDKTLQKVQVGPFNTKEEANEALNKAKEINSGAFIVKSAN